ncbi:MAG TPA: FimV/HubP family polar landmark protein [Steroidobacteraceae bacterium]|nr:FimV/HubP family polar landmark protein [Steroidobacteraceae bacterium]
MPNGKNPLMLMMALSMPGAAQALGLGDIHVDSALNERLVAEIDIVGATAIELNDLRAAVANRETFLRYGADRPGFLSTATFKVAQDSQGRPILAVRSTEAFTEPLVNFLVDLHWRNNELVRQYTLLLDPPGFATAPAAAAAVALAASPPAVPDQPNVPAAAAAATPILERKTQTVARQVDPPSDRPNTGSERAARKTTHIKVGAKATLRGIAWRVGERSPSDLRRMMIAIFRANPSAFDGNINRLHLGAVLTIPSPAEVAAISSEEAKREFHLQMAAWHSPGRAMHAGTSNPSTSIPVASATQPPSVAAATVAPAAAPPVSAAAPASSAGPVVPQTEELARRVQSLEHELVEVQGLLDRQRDQLVDMKEQVALVEKTTPAAMLGTELPAADAPGADAPSAQDPAAMLGTELPTADAPGTDAPVAEAPAAMPGTELPTADVQVANAQGANAPSAEDPVDAPVKSGHTFLVPFIGGFGLLAGAAAALYFRLRRRAPKPNTWRTDISEEMPVPMPVQAIRGGDTVSPDDTLGSLEPMTQAPVMDQARENSARIQATTELARDAQSDALVDATVDDDSDTQEAPAPTFDENTHPMIPVPAQASFSMPKRVNHAAATISRPEPEDSVSMSVATAKLPASVATAELKRIDTTRLDYNLVDLDLTAQHVQMPSVLNEQVVVKERRTNLADVLKLAIEREPDRHDLRMKLLELYYSAAATNRQAFLEVVQKFARDRDYLQPDQWEKILFMGRQIAADNPLFAEPSAADDDLADCA